MDYPSDRPATAYQCEYLRFFDLPVPNGMTYGEAERAVVAHRRRSTTEQKAKWATYVAILDGFEEPERASPHVERVHHDV